MKQHFEINLQLVTTFLPSIAGVGLLAAACQGQVSEQAPHPGGVSPQQGAAGVPPVSGGPAESPGTAPPGTDAMPNLPGEPPIPAIPPVTPTASDPVLGACDGSYRPHAIPSQLLGREQLAETLAALFEANDLSANMLPADTSAGEFVVAESQITSESYVRQLQASVEQLARDHAATQLTAIETCAALSGSELSACVEPWLSTKLRQAFRRPPSADELSSYSGFLAEQNVNWGFEQAVSQVLQAMASDPRLLYRIETTAGVGDENGLAPVDAHSLAARLSYFVTGGPPDAELSALADSGALALDPQLLAQQAQRLVDAEGGDLFDTFLRRWLGVDFSNVTKSDALRAGNSQAALTQAWNDSFSTLVRETLLSGSGTIAELLTTTDLSLPPELTELYGDLGPRSGILTHPGLLAQFAHDHSSPVLRGVFVREHLLCAAIPPPPPDVELEVPEATDTNTTRERYELIEEQAACAGCHQLIHSFGFAFEEYDALGRYRTQEDGFPIDASGSFFGFNDPSLTGEFTGVKAMGEAIAGSQQLASCVSKSLYESAIGRHLDSLDRCELQQLSLAFHNPNLMGGKLSELVVAIATSPRFKNAVVETVAQGGQ